MKKSLFLLSLIVAILISIAAGTLAVYNVEIEQTASVMAKEFILEEENSFDSFEYDIKIAPSLSVEFNFAIRNFRNNIVSEVPITSKITVLVDGAPYDKNNLTKGYRNPIGPLKYTVYETDVNGNILKTKGTLNGIGIGDVTTGQFDFNEFFPLQQTGQIKYYKVKIFWPVTSNDTYYLSPEFGSRVRINAYGEQGGSPIPEDPEDPGDPGDPGDPEDPGDPVLSDFSNTSMSFTKIDDGNLQFTITNIGDHDITNGWAIDLDENAQQIFSQMSSSKLLVPERWNVLQMVSRNNRYILFPTTGSYPSPSYTIRKGESLTYQINLKKKVLKNFNVFLLNSLKVRFPYDVSKVKISFDDTLINANNGYLHMQIQNLDPYGCIFGWSVRFKTNAILSESSYVQFISSANGINTYQITTLPTNDRGIMTYIQYGEKNRVFGIDTQWLPAGTPLTITDVSLDGSPVTFTPPPN